MVAVSNKMVAVSNKMVAVCINYIREGTNIGQNQIETHDDVRSRCIEITRKVGRPRRHRRGDGKAS